MMEGPGNAPEETLILGSVNTGVIEEKTNNQVTLLVGV